MNPTAPVPADAAPAPQPVSGAPPGTGADAFAAILAALASQVPPPTPAAEAPGARTAPAEGTTAGSDSSGPDKLASPQLSTKSGSTTTGRGDVGVVIVDSSAEVESVGPAASDNANGLPADDLPIDDPVLPGDVPVEDPLPPDAQADPGPAPPASAARPAPEVPARRDPEANDPGAPLIPSAPRSPAHARPDPAERGIPRTQPVAGDAPSEIPIEGLPVETSAEGSELPTDLDSPIQPLGDEEPAEKLAIPASVDAGGSTASQRANAGSPVAGTQAIGGESRADAPEPGASRPVTARLHDLVDKTRATIRVAVRGGRTDARITLRPPELGEVRIALRYEGGGVSAALTADSSRAVEVLLQASSDLRRSLEEHGVTVQSLDVKLSGDEARREAGSPWQDGRGPSQRLSLLADEEPEPTHEQIGLPTPEGRIDVLA